MTVVGPLRPGSPVVLAELRGTTNPAVGSAHWSLADPLRDLGVLADSVQITPDGESVEDVAGLADGRTFVIAVRDAYRTAWQRDWVRAALSRRPDAVLVCLGMPNDADLGGATVIMTYGAGRVNTVTAANRLAGLG
jgi:beta-N-acetylhexosaminidase